MRPTLKLGAARSLDGERAVELRVPVDDPTTRAAVVGMTGSGKTGWSPRSLTVSPLACGGTPFLSAGRCGRR